MVLIFIGLICLVVFLFTLSPWLGIAVLLLIIGSIFNAFDNPGGYY